MDDAPRTDWQATPFDLVGKTALVTGGAKRLGKGVCLALAEAGANVVVHYRSSEEEAREVCAEAETHGATATAVRADLADTRDWAAFIDECRAWQGDLDILVNNASTYPCDHLADYTEADLLTNMQVHAFAPLALSRAFAEGTERGRLINFLDARVVAHDREHFSYHMSKRLLLTMTQFLAVELAPNVTVNAVAPGPILPPPGESEEYLKRAAGFVPMNRAGTVKEVADAVLFLLRSDFITGQVLYVDGGRHLLGGPYR